MYKPGRGVDDAKLFILNFELEHLEQPGSYARLLYDDFSSAFNTMQLLHFFDIICAFVVLDIVTSCGLAIVIFGFFDGLMAPDWRSSATNSLS